MAYEQPSETAISARVGDVTLAACLGVLVAGSALALVAAWRWPLVGDSALIRYVVFLLESGKTPYSQVIDINLPGSYLLEALAMKCLGWGALGLRCYDGFLSLGFCGLACLLPAQHRRERLGCLGGGLLFLLIHLQDGLTEAGQRDLALAVWMLAGVVVLARVRRRPVLAIFCFEVIVGFTLTIKPTVLPMALLPLIVESDRSNGWGRTTRSKIAAPLTGVVLFPAMAAGWLMWTGSFHAFVGMTASIGLLHGQLGRHGVGFLAAHCTAPVTVLFALWLVVLATRVLAFDAVRRLLLAATLCGLISYVEQGKGLSYQRYPFLGVALVLIGLDVARCCGMSRPGKLRTLAYSVSLATVVCVMVWFAPRFTVAVRSFDASQPFEDHLAQSLRATPGTVQCLDTFGGCIDTLYEMRTVQATGYLYDCYLFSPPSAVRERYREQFLRSFNAAHPQIVVLTNQPCFEPAKNYDRLTTWPAFHQEMERDYRLKDEWHTDRTYRWWSRWERPIAYQIYVLR